MQNRNFALLPFFLALSLAFGMAGCSKHKPPKPTDTAALGSEDLTAAGAEFMAQNAKQPGVITLPSGLQYKVITTGDGKTPTAEDYATVNYIGYHMDGRELDSSYKLGKPVTVPVSGLIPGWAEALRRMKEGSKWELFIPADLAYGKEGVEGFIKPGEALRFEVELIKIHSAREVANLRLKKFQAQEAYRLKNDKFLTENGKKPDVITTPSGLEYKVIRKGTGAKPKLDDMVEVNYRGTLIDGREFDSSYARGEPATFPVDKVIKGWTEALIMMKKGSKWRIYVPASLAYGTNGAGDKIPPDSTLIFDVELLNIK